MNWAYLVQCADGSLYAGWTNDLEKRLAAHNSGKGAKYTRGRGPVTLAWAGGYETKAEAMRQEALLKRMSRAGKLALACQYAQGGNTDGIERSHSQNIGEKSGENCAGKSHKK